MSLYKYLRTAADGDVFMSVVIGGTEKLLPNFLCGGTEAEP